MPHRCGTPRSIAQLATLVSIDHQTLRNTAWTINTLIRMSPVTHTRYGNHGRSGGSSGFILRTYRTNTSFLNKLREKIDARSNDADVPFSDEPQTTALNDTPKPPIRIKLTRDNKYHHPGDDIYNITPHLEFLGLHKFNGEWVCYNHTRSQIIINGTPSLHSRVSGVMHQIITGPRNINFQARMVTVDHKGRNYIEWTPEKISQADPKFLAKYATTARSGEKSTHGKPPSTKSERNLVTGKPIEGYSHHFEVTPTIGESGERIDLCYSIKSKPLGDSKIIVKITSSTSLKDGKPSIIELGHPSSATLTHLLILNADIVTPDGSFYRDQFKPVE